MGENQAVVARVGWHDPSPDLLQRVFSESFTKGGGGDVTKHNAHIDDTVEGRFAGSWHSRAAPRLLEHRGMRITSQGVWHTEKAPESALAVRRRSCGAARVGGRVTLARGRVRTDYTTGCLRIARATQAPSPWERLLFAIKTLLAISETNTGWRWRWRQPRELHRRVRKQRRRRSRASSDFRVNAGRSFATTSATCSPAQHDRPCRDFATIRRRRRTCVCMFMDKGVRNASLAIYVLRHTSSPALAPAAHIPPFSLFSPVFLRPLPQPSRGPPAPYVRSFLSPSTTACKAARWRWRAMPPPHRRTDRFAVPSAPVAATTGRGWYCVPDVTAPINRDPVSSPDVYSGTHIPLVQPSEVPLVVRSVLSTRCSGNTPSLSLWAFLVLDNVGTYTLWHIPSVLDLTNALSVTRGYILERSN